jgi:hypothetical protein
MSAHSPSCPASLPACSLSFRRRLGWRRRWSRSARRWLPRRSSAGGWSCTLTAWRCTCTLLPGGQAEAAGSTGTCRQAAAADRGTAAAHRTIRRRRQAYSEAESGGRAAGTCGADRLCHMGLVGYECSPRQAQADRRSILCFASFFVWTQPALRAGPLASLQLLQLLSAPLHSLTADG